LSKKKSQKHLNLNILKDEKNTQYSEIIFSNLDKLFIDRFVTGRR
jgi:hypothetical protein